MTMNNSTATVDPKILASANALEANGYEIEMVDGLTNGGTEGTILYVYNYSKQFAKVTLDEDGYPVVSKAHESSPADGLKRVYAIVTRAARQA